MITEKELGDYYKGNEILRETDEEGNKHVFKILKLNIPIHWELKNIETEEYAIISYRDNQNICCLCGSGDVELSDIYKFGLDIITFNNEKVAKERKYNDLSLYLREIVDNSSLEDVEKIVISISDKQPRRNNKNK